MLHSDEVKQALATARPYGDWVNTETLRIQASFDSLADDRFDAAALSRVFGYTAEERRLVIADMAQGDNPLGSMGDDTGLAVLATKPTSPHPVLPRAIRPGDQPADGSDPGEAGHVAPHPARAARASPRGPPTAGTSHRAVQPDPVRCRAGVDRPLRGPALLLALDRDHLGGGGWARGHGAPVGRDL